MGDDKRYGIGELARLGGVSRRTVRYYVQRGLLPTPTGTGRGDHYTQRHLDSLIQIRLLQDGGVPLADIAQRLAGTDDATGAASAPQVPTHSQWARLRLAEGLELHVRLDRFRLDQDRLARLIEAFRRIMGQSASV